VKGCKWQHYLNNAWPQQNTEKKQKRSEAIISEAIAANLYVRSLLKIVSDLKANTELIATTWAEGCLIYGDPVNYHARARSS
jgi:hypothetical protein